MAQGITTLGLGNRLPTGCGVTALVKCNTVDDDPGHHLPLSHDRGWYDPALPGGGNPKPFTHLSEFFLPKLRQAGVDESTIRQLTQSNPFRAVAR